MPRADDEKPNIFPAPPVLLVCLAVVTCGYLYPLLRARPSGAPVSTKIFPANEMPAPVAQP